MKRRYDEIKMLIQEKLEVKLVDAAAASAINLCESPEMTINYTYKEMGCQVMILDIGAHVSIAGVSWMTQYLKEFGLTIDEMKSTRCNQPFVFGPSKIYISKSLIKLPVFVIKLDRQEDILVIHTYLVEEKFLSCVGDRHSKSGTLQSMERTKFLNLNPN